jgi:heme/copper-type cytochrome/quinol oxidase subunit 2
LALVVVVLLHSVAAACPGCKEAVAANDPEKSRMARGYFWSIIFMLSMPPAIVCTLGGYFYYEVRRARAEKSEKARVKSEK